MTQAATSTRNVVRSLREVVGFDKLLAASDAELASEPSPVGEPNADQSLLEKTVATIRQRIADFGLEWSGELSLSTQADGGLRLESVHEQAAAIEMSLSGDPELTRLVASLHVVHPGVNLRIASQPRSDHWTT